MLLYSDQNNTNNYVLTLRYFYLLSLKYKDIIDNTSIHLNNFLKQKHINNCIFIFYIINKFIIFVRLLLYYKRLFYWSRANAPCRVVTFLLKQIYY